MSVSRREVHEHYREYIVNNPCYADDIQKAIAWALADLPEDKRGYGDAFQVIARDEEIVIRVQVANERSQTLRTRAGSAEDLEQ